MAPIGAYIAKYQDFPLSDLGPKLNFGILKEISMSHEFDLDNKSITCSIQYVDSFGNGTTSIQLVDNKIKELDTLLEEGTKIKVSINQEKYEGENFPEQEYKTFLKAYSLALHKTGDSEHGDEIAWEAEKMDTKS